MFLAHPWEVRPGSLEQGLGLMDVPRGRPGCRPGDERSYAPDYYFIIYKINLTAPGSEGPFVPGLLDPDGPRNHLFSSRSIVPRKIYPSTLPIRRTTVSPRKLFWVLGCWVVVCVKADYFPGAGGVGSLRLRPLFVPSIAVPSRLPRLIWIKSIYRPPAPLSLSLSLYPRR